jgi:hypothetical protein
MAIEGAKAIGASGNHSNFVVETLHGTHWRSLLLARNQLRIRWKLKINQIETLAIPAYGIYATADPTLLGALAEGGVSVRGTGDIPSVPRGTPAVLVGLKP